MTTLFEAKWWIASRTMWFNLIVAAFALVEQFSPILQPYLPANSFAMLTTILVVGNVVLRILTQIKLRVK